MPLNFSLFVFDMKKHRETVSMYDQIFQTSTIRDKWQKSWTTCMLALGLWGPNFTSSNSPKWYYRKCVRTSYENLSINHQILPSATRNVWKPVRKFYTC